MVNIQQCDQQKVERKNVEIEMRDLPIIIQMFDFLVNKILGLWPELNKKKCYL